MINLPLGHYIAPYLLKEGHMAKKKNPAAVKLGRLGGLARAKKLSKKELSEIGKAGGRPRKKPVDKT